MIGTDLIAKDSPVEQVSGLSINMAREFRFVSRSGDYATPWRLIPKDGIGGAMYKLKEDQRKGLGEDYSLQLRRFE